MLIPKFSFNRRARPIGSAAEGAEEDAAQRFHRLVMPHLDAAYNYGRYLTRDSGAAEDVVQEAFLRAWKGFASCRGNEKPWLLAIVRNCYHDWLRTKNRIEKNYSNKFESTSHISIDDANIAIDMVKMKEFILKLPESFREILILREFEGLSYRDIAGIVEIPIGTVMSRLARARDLLARHLLDGGDA